MHTCYCKQKINKNQNDMTYLVTLFQCLSFKHMDLNVYRFNKLACITTWKREALIFDNQLYFI